MRKTRISLVILAASYLSFDTGCRQTTPENPLPVQKSNRVSADAETRSVRAGRSTDAADDPAIWVHPTDPEKSLIIGTNKVAGLAVYSLQGEEIRFYPVGRANNVDIRYGFEFGNGDRADVVGCTERNQNEILLFRIDPANGSLNQIRGNRMVSEHPDIYGFCMYHSPTSHQYYAISNDKDGTIEQWYLSPEGADEIAGQLVRTLKVSSQPEGMVADDVLAHLYVGEETRGIWKFPAEPDDTGKAVLLEASTMENPAIVFDIEGLAIYHAPMGKGYLLASSQGNNSYAIFTRGRDNRYLGSFQIVDGPYDRTSETDGLDVTNLGLGNPFGNGLLVVQDGANMDGASSRPQNFKLVAWEKVAGLFEPALTIGPDYKGYIQTR
jgi:3-phytase